MRRANLDPGRDEGRAQPVREDARIATVAMHAERVGIDALP